MKMFARLKSILPLVAATLGGAALAAGTPALAGAGTDYSGKMKDAWLDGRIETAYALNEHLNPFDIGTEVADGVVTLDGTVDSDIERDLAAEIAASVDGVTQVDNRIEVSGTSDMAKMTRSARAAAGKFMDRVDDATITATVKSKLMANDNIKGLSIDVDTRDDVVTLSGAVTSDEQRELAGMLAKNVSDVASVENRLIVVSQ